MSLFLLVFFFFNDTATTEIYTLSLHDALPISLGVSHVSIACTKGFGLEYEKPLIERAARFAEKAEPRGITTSAYIQGFPVYYETFLIEAPQAIDWLARTQTGDFVPWGGQTFRRWMDP